MSRRSFWAWGLEQDEPTEQQVREAAARLSQRYGVAVEPVMPPRGDDLQLRAPRIGPPSSLAAICATDDHDRAVHTYGRSFRDRIRAYNLQFPNPPDVVAHPTTEDEVTAVLDWCSSNGYAAIPYGGGSSTVAGFEPPDGYDGIVTIDLSALDQVLEVDGVSPLGANPGRGLRAGAGGAVAAPRLHPASLPAELRVLVTGRLGSLPAQAATMPPTTPTLTISWSRCAWSRRRACGSRVVSPAAGPAPAPTAWPSAARASSASLQRLGCGYRPGPSTGPRRE